MEKYTPVNIESKWQDFWDQEKLFKAELKEGTEKKYVLSMFPYPSGALHMGHVMNYTISDLIVRYHIMKGNSVLSPIGWDSFGLPAENAAIKEGIHPSETIKKNITKMKEQMKSAGWGFDWDREIATSSEEYYKWTQWLFLKFYEAGMVEQKNAPVNWCPSCATVLANEQVHDGGCERCKTTVEQKNMVQWFYMMSKYSERLLKNHNDLNEWPERVIKMQKAWIGRSEGAEINFKFENSDESISVFTTRPDTLHGVTFMSMAPQHPLVDSFIEDHPDRENFEAKIKEMRSLSTSEADILTREKEGVFTGKYVINPVNGEKVQLWVANFVLMTYGTGVVMAVPAHDQRDFEFARKYDIPLKVVIQPEDARLVAEELTEAYTEDGLMYDSGEFTGKHNRKSMGDFISWLDEKGYGKKTINYRLRDWLLSRQRYWGAPIPIIHCDDCGAVPVPEKDLPVRLPMDAEFRPTGESPLASSKTFMNTECPKCGKPAKRESDTMDTFVDSSWYYLRYISPKYTEGPFDKDEINQWGPVDIYIGGVEHATMHLIYFRFFAHVMKDLGLVDFEEPAKRLFCQGMVCKTAHYCDTHKWLEEEKVVDGKCADCGKEVESEITKMSKTKLNVISPEAIIERFGADTMRMYIVADNPPDKDQVWSEEGVIGVHRFMNRLWDTCSEALDFISKGEFKSSDDADKELRRIAHGNLEKCIAVFNDSWQFNTAVARIMELLNAFRKQYKGVSESTIKEIMEILLKLVAPIAPHIAEEIWSIVAPGKGSVFASGFPEVDKSALTVDTVTVVVQINGKLRANFQAAAETAKEELEKTALEIDKIKKQLEGKTVRKVIVIKNKIVNIVAN